MERGRAKEARRRKFIRERAAARKEKPPRRALSKRVIKELGRSRVIGQARKKLRESAEQERQTRSAVDELERESMYTANDLLRLFTHAHSGQKKNLSHGETSFEAEAKATGRESTGKKVTGQRHAALSRRSSIHKSEHAKQQGRRFAQREAARRVWTGGRGQGYSVLHRFGAALGRAVKPGASELLVYGGLALVLLIPLLLLAGISIGLFGGGEGRSTYVPVSEEVEAYRPLIRLYAAQHGIPEYEDLIAAVMMQESGGRGLDPMQCSACGFNTRYPHAPNSITDPEYSIDVGIQNLADCLRLAGADSPIDLESISLALQGYNYGSGYISWAKANYGGYSELSAIEFSDLMAARSGSAGYGDKAYVSHVLRYYPIGRSFMGAGNAALVAVAQSQLGNEGGMKYCEWYGYSYRVEWCAVFVSWCADQCGYLDAGVLPKMAGVRPYVNWFKERGQWQSRDYEPSPGDIIFFDWESDGLADHIGIVEKVEAGFVYTIEGNTGDRCAEKRYTLASAPVYGYGLPLF